MMGLGISVSGAGDVNGDGFDDILIGATLAGDGNKGQAYLIFGKDFSNNTIVGSGNFSGTSQADNLVGSHFNDEINSLGGNDAISAGAGDDTIIIYDESFLRIDGGQGLDTLKINASDFELDLSSIGNTFIKDIEIIDLTGNGNNRLIFDYLDINALGGLRQEGIVTLIVEGNEGDSISTSFNWRQGTIEYNDETYKLFERESFQLIVNQAIDSTEIDTNVPPIIPLNQNFYLEENSSGAFGTVNAVGGINIDVLTYSLSR